MPDEREVYLPPQYAIDGKVLGNPVLQLRKPAYRGVAYVEEYSKYGMNGSRVIVDTDEATRDVLIMPRRTNASHPVNSILVAPEATVAEKPSDFHSLDGRTRWLDPAPTRTTNIDSANLAERTNRIRATWKDRFHFVREQSGDAGEKDGLRSPQIGALYAALAHWTIGSEPATIVMPTGTGKTETMLAVTAHQCPGRLLVIVPTSTLRDQIAGKFVTWGILKRFGILGSEASYPQVGKMEHTLGDASEVEEYFGCCNVVVATMSVLRSCSSAVRESICDACTHLFIDEAHHIGASSWDAFRRRFLDSGEAKPVMQFTATPYRNDGKHIGGETIYEFPLRKAQEQDYFATINFDPVREYRPSRKDESIARKAVGQLEQDRDAGKDHLVMARASSIRRAEEIHATYEEVASGYNPVLVHSNQSQKEQQEATDALFDRESRIVVCVNMFGEGFDLPELKVAALHDVHKSLGVTIQFTGRFARWKDELGDATVIANTADAKVEEAVQRLYGDDPDWNVLLQRLTEEESERQQERSEFFDTFGDDLPEALPIQNIFPKMSTVVYRTEGADWQPGRVADGISSRHELYGEPIISQRHNTVAFVTRFESPVSWGDMKGFVDVTWDLYVLHWNPPQDLLYINSSNNNSVHKRLAEKVCGEDTSIIRGEQVFKVLSGINRLMFMNVGLSHAISRTLTFTMYAGANVQEGLTKAQVHDRFKTNLFGRGYEDGTRTSTGGSRKGRVWSYRVADDLQEWIEWCHQAGAKLLDDSISVQSILENAMQIKVIGERPPGVPVAVDWSEALYLRNQETTYFTVDGEHVPFLNVGIEPLHHDGETPLRFAVFTDERRVEYEVRFEGNDVTYAPMDGKSASIETGRSPRALADWFQEEPPVIRFADTSYLLYNEFYQLPEGRSETYDREQIEVWDWSDADITTESQYKHVKVGEASKFVGRVRSIQRKVIEVLQAKDGDEEYDAIIDDDDSGEAADVVALRRGEDTLEVHLYHCKYSSEDYPGARVGDLYEVCGQAQRSAYWKFQPERLLAHLISRAGDRLDKYGTSRFEVGDFDLLDQIVRELPYREPILEVYVVQPGLDRRRASKDQLDLLASTELYLRESSAADFHVIGQKTSL